MNQNLKLYIEGKLVHTEYLKIPKLSAYVFKKRIELKEEIISNQVERVKLMYPDTAFREYYFILTIQPAYKELPVEIK